MRTPIKLDAVESAVLRTEPMIAVSSVKMRAGGGEKIRLRELTDCPLILYRR